MNKLYSLLYFLLLITTYSILSIPTCYLSFNQQTTNHSHHSAIRTYQRAPRPSHLPQNSQLTYSSSQLKDYFDYHHYSDQEVLSQNSLYISDEFVQLTKTYPGYASHIRHLYKKLKHMSIASTIANTLFGSYSKKLFKKIQKLHKEIEHNKQSIDLATAQYAACHAIDLEELCPYNSNPTAHNIYHNYLHILHEASLINKRNTIVRDCIGQASYIGLEANKNGYTQQASQLADFCWTLIDCTKAFGEGICLGTVRTIDTLTHPIETVKNGLIGIGIIACELGKLTKTTGDFALLYATNNDRYYIQKEAITKQLKMIIKDTTHYLHTTPTRNIVKQGTAFLTEGILLTKIGTFAHNIAQRLLLITKNYFEYIIKKEPTACLADGTIIEIPKSIDGKSFKSIVQKMESIQPISQNIPYVTHNIQEITNAIAAMEPNRIHHILTSKTGKHAWCKVCKNPLDWEEIKNIIKKVMLEGSAMSQKIGYEKTLTIGQDSIAVRYTYKSDGTLSISNAWVIT